MPTGYTADVQSGKIETLQDYAFGCARAFGALVMMREDPKDAPIPESLKPEIDYHERGAAKAEAILAEELTIEDGERMALEKYENALSSFAKSTIDNQVRLDRYNAMLVKVRDWEAPTKDHQGLRSFMIEQLESSINWDIHEPEVPTKMTGAELVEIRIQSANRDIEYHTEHIAEEIKRTEDRNLWLSNLRMSLEDSNDK